MATAKNQFENVASQLAEADIKARMASGDANQARADRSGKAVDTIKIAFKEAVDPDVVRITLIDKGVLKGTVSKIVTILRALNDTTIAESELTSLSSGYALVKERQAPPVPPILPPEPVTITVTKEATPDEALKIIIDHIRAEKDPDKALALASVWLTKVTNGITEATAKATAEEE